MWDLADTDQNGFLSPNEFKTALALIALAQQGLQLRDDHPVLLRTGRVPVPPPPRLRGLAGLPPAAPPSIQAPASAAPMPHLAPVGWPPLTADDARRYAAAFAAWDRDRDGRVTGAEIAPFFKQSRCPDPVRLALRRDCLGMRSHLRCYVSLLQSWFKVIWDLADGDADGTLTAPEFAVAAYFLDRAAEGRCVDFQVAIRTHLDQKLTPPRLARRRGRCRCFLRACCRRRRRWRP